MKWLAIAIMYLGFFSLIGGAVYLTGSAWCLWALLLTPSVKNDIEGPVKTEENK